MIVTRVGGMATLLTDREDAVVVPPQDAQALAEGIRWLVTHPQEASQIGMAAYALVRQQFSVERMIEQVLAVYDRAAK